MNRKIYYDVHESGLIYRPDDGEKLSLNWRDIQYIEDRSGDRVDIFLNNQKEVPVRYATNEFSVLLKTICLKLADIRSESFSSQKFKLTLMYFLHLSFVISAIGLFLLGSLFVDKTVFFMLLVLSVPFGIILLRQPISLTLKDQSLTVGNLLAKQTVNYDEIQNIGFEVRRNQYGSTLCILITLKDGTEMAFKKFENIILFFIMLQIKLNENKRSNNGQQD
ncbi:MAG: hypothetical protein JRF27_04870 [Deltaproteobacteria bacterium]|nr:hypothetical protein [Deltaproteobacteria bacterium]